MKILFLSTEQNKVWTSMQEILPGIESVWSQYAKDHQALFTRVEVDTLGEKGLKTYAAAIIETDIVVVQAFNAQIAATLKVIRSSFQNDAPWVFYLHGLASVGLWPLFTYDIGELLTEADLFIGTCPGDECALKCTLPNARYFQTHFFSENSPSYLPPLAGKESIHKLIYIGRLSRQKNLPTLLWAFSELKRKEEKFQNLELHLFGKEDQLGSPNMGMESHGHERELHELCKELVLEEDRDIFFRGFVSREDIAKELTEERCVFVSPSLHSDENFGMAAQMALEGGAFLFLTNWGGHQNFGRLYPKRVKLFDVSLGERGPFLRGDKLTYELAHFLEEFKERSVAKEENYQTRSLAVQDCLKIVNLLKKGGPSLKQRRLRLSSLVQEMLDFRQKTILGLDLKKHPKNSKKFQQVFTSYEDPHAHQFFEAYGAQREKREWRERDLNLTDWSLLPWAKANENSSTEEWGVIEVDDPHKGPWQGSLLEAYQLGYLVKKN